MHRFGVEVYPGYRVDEPGVRATHPARKGDTGPKTKRERPKTDLPSRQEMADWLCQARGAFIRPIER